MKPIHSINNVEVRFVKVNLQIPPLVIRAQILIFHKLLVFYS